MNGNKSERELREADELAGEINSWWGRSFAIIKRTRVRTWKGVAILAFIAGVAAAVVWLISMDIQSSSDASTRQRSPLMKAIKSGGCVADGVLSAYGGQPDKEINMITHSECRYLHRSLETWAAPPDFEQAGKIMNKIKEKKPDMIFGMFLAEAVNPNSTYYYPDEKINFDFSKMCRKDSEDFWGGSTCKGYFGSEEYRKYLSYITRRAIDMGIQSFLFGQIFFQDNGTGMRSWAKEITDDMRSYAREKNKEIVIGAQTNNITDEKYLRLFDYIEGGAGINPDGKIEDGPCFSKWSQAQNSCWALLWNEKYSAKANDILLHLDWSGFQNDDMSIFARMDKSQREDTIKKLYNFFHERNMGFMLPYFAVIYENNGSCYGPAKNYYSASIDYSCSDEKAWNTIIKKGMEKNDAKFVEQTVPSEMIAGENYRAEIKIKNTGNTTWTKENNFRLGSQNPQDNDFWGDGRVDFEENEKIKPGETAVFIFNVTAPKEPGVYDFQWKMLEEGTEWFGDMTNNLKISVLEKETKATPENEGIEKAEAIEEVKVIKEIEPKTEPALDNAGGL